MIGWAPKKKGRTASQERMAAKALERKAIKAYMAPVDQYNAMNLYYADLWLSQRAEIGDNDYRIKYAIQVMRRLKPELEF